jgi:hypothetical protein
MTNTIRAADLPAWRLLVRGPALDVHPHNAGLVAVRCTAGTLLGLLTLANPRPSLAILVLLPGVCPLVRMGTAPWWRRGPGDHPAAGEGAP